MCDQHTFSGVNFMVNLTGALVPWGVEADSTYNGRAFWTLWKPDRGVYGGRRYLLAKGGSDRKRFYDQAKAVVEAERLNAADAKVPA
jgi:hypothetical protein